MLAGEERKNRADPAREERKNRVEEEKSGAKV